MALFVILYFTVFMKNRYKRVVRDLSSRFERSHGLLFGQDNQFIKRLETVSSLNLTMVQDYMDWNRKFKDIRDVSDASAQAAVNNCRDLLSTRKYHELKESLPGARKILETYEQQVNSLDSSLKRKFIDEEDARAKAFDQREKLRKVKSEYNAHMADLSLVLSSFNIAFDKLDRLFDQVDQDIENAQYLDAKTLLANDIGQVVDAFDHYLKVLPGYCIRIQSVLPDKLASLHNRFEEMLKAGYPLFHIMVSQDFTEMNDHLSDLANRVRGFSFVGVDAELDEMTHRIDDYGTKFDEEKSARTVFESECDKIYSDENILEKNFINLCHALPAVRKIFLLSGEQARIDSIQNTINKAGALKRGLDAYIHSSTRQPYSSLVEKMHALRDQGLEANKQISDFQNYLASLKVDSEKANDALPVYWDKLKEAEKTVKEIALAPISAQFGPSIDEIYAKLDALSKDIHTTPIDVKKVNEDLALLTGKADQTFADIAKAHDEMLTAEKSIVYANRFRFKSGEINTLLTQAEGLFYAGKFAAAEEAATEAISHLTPEGK